MLALVLIALVLLAILAAGCAQLAIPRIAEGRVRRRLTEGGGIAEVSIRSFPASRLLHNAGDRIEVRGRSLRIGLAGESFPTAESPAGLAALDGFTDVDIELVDFSTGPFAVAAFVLTRVGHGTYAMATQATTTAAEIARFGVERLPGLPPIPGLPGLGLLGSAAAQAIGGREITVAVQIELISEQGRLRVGSGGGTIGGFPAGPLATMIAASVARRLEIVP